MSNPAQYSDQRPGSPGPQVSKQLNLFDNPDWDVVPEICRAMNETIQSSGLSRDQVCDRMNAFAARRRVSLASGNAHGLTKDMLDKWLNPHDRRVIPLRGLVVFCAVMDTRAPFEVMLRPCGLEVMGHEERMRANYAEAVLEQKRAGRTVRTLEKELLG